MVTALQIWDNRVKLVKLKISLFTLLTIFTLSKGIPLYHIDRVVRETGRIVDNGFDEIYVNAAINDGSDVSELMEVFVSETAYNDKFPLTSAEKRRYKETEEGQEIMCEIVEKLNTEARKEGREEGRKEGREEVNTLIAHLISENRIDDLRRAATDLTYQSQLLRELFPQRAH